MQGDNTTPTAPAVAPSVLESETFSASPTLINIGSDSEKKSIPNDLDKKISNCTPSTTNEKEHNEKCQDVTAGAATPNATAESQYISGMKLYSLMASLVLCFFTIMLDMSIVSTVCLIFIIYTIFSLGET
jgi:F0F1-type ATP synthase assembly protein I